MAIEGAEILGAGFAGICAVGGVFFLKVAILEGNWWPTDRRQSPPRSRNSRVACGFASLALIAVGLAAVFYARPGVTSVSNGLQVDKERDFSSKIELLGTRVVNIERDKSAALRIAALSVELRTLRAGVLVNDVLGTSCSLINPDGSSALPAAEWSQRTKSKCDEFKDAQWTVELGGALKSKSIELIKELDALSIRYVFGNVPPDQSGALSDNLGMVFDDRVPHALICRLREAYSRATGLQLQGAMLQQTYIDVVRSPISTFAIHLGVPFGEIVDGNYTRITDSIWTSICANKAKFDIWFQNNESQFKAKAVLQKRT